MRKVKLIAALAVIVFMGTQTSCKKDIELINDLRNKPVHLQGTFSPTYGMPLGTASMSMKDLLGMFNDIGDYVIIDSASDFVIIHYADTIETTFDIDDSKGARTKAAYVYRRTMSGGTDFDIFRDIEFLPEGDDSLMVQHLLLRLGARVKPVLSTASAALLAQADISVYYDDIHIMYRAFDGTQDEFDIDIDSIGIPLDSLANENFLGTYQVLFDSLDVSEIINSRPTEISYSFRFNIAVNDPLQALSMASYLTDELGMVGVNLVADFSVDFPISLYVNNLQFNTSLDLSGANINFSEVEMIDSLSFDSALVIMRISNGLPLGLQLNGDFMKDGQSIGTAFSGSPIYLNPAQIGVNSGVTFGSNTYYTSVNPVTSDVRLSLTADDFDLINQADSLRLNITVATSHDFDGPIDVAKPCVTIKGNDALKIDLRARVKPRVNVDIPIFSLGD